jgi:hypothetical protein
VDAAVDQHGIDRHAAARIEPARIGECDQPRYRLGHGPAGQLRPALQQKCPFVVVPGLADASLHSPRRRPVRGKELGQGAAHGIDEFLEA